jgi:hypothetical protein
MGEEVEVVTLDPAVESTIANSFEGEEQPQRDHFTRVKVGEGVFGYISHYIIYSAKELCDKLLGRHRVAPPAVVCSPTASDNPGVNPCYRTVG